MSSIPWPHVASGCVPDSAELEGERALGADGLFLFHILAFSMGRRQNS